MYGIENIAATIERNPLKLLDLAFHVPIEFIPLPINIDDIAKVLGLFITIDYSLANTDVVSKTEYVNGIGNIYINPTENIYVPRRRFTVAHGIGHFILHAPHKNFGVVDTQKTMSRTHSYWNKEESEANLFAADILMPTPLIFKEAHKIIAQNKNNVTLDYFITSMANSFLVPQKAMVYKLQDLEIIKL